MPSSGMGRYYPLTNEEISQAVKVTRPGAYALGHINKGSAFCVDYIGRSDADLADCLKKHAEAKQYPYFKFMCLKSAKAAFEKECNLYHDFKPDGNDKHPEDSKGNTKEKCPRCPKI
ncbi:hypothetical protein FAI40_01765 [Acetobacteraceae bacterium]|nr:hypothetical protein FAI40_01765 [Acetobacteraceae bacterium]